MSRFSWAVLAILMTACPPLLWGAEVVVTVGKITGKAQLQQGDGWVPLAVGRKLTAGDTVSTGFRSEMQLQIGPSTVTIKPLSRLTIQKLTQEGTSLQTDLYLKVGKVEAEVNKSEAVQKQKFTVSSPVATASVRGTAFSFDGFNLRVSRGLVDFSDLKGNTVSIPVGESARVSSTGSGQGITTNQNLVVQESVVSAEADAGVVEEDGATLEWSGWSYEDLLTLLYGYSWSWVGGETSLYVGGIEPLPIPAFSHISLSGIVPFALPSATTISIGGIGTYAYPTATYLTIGGISTFDIPSLTHLTLGGISTEDIPSVSQIAIGGIIPNGGSQP